MSLGSVFKRLFGNQDGNVMLTFSLAFPVLLGAAGMAVDSASFYDQQSRMQSVADASALAVAKELHLYRKKPEELDQLKSVGKGRVEALLTEAGIEDQPHTTTIDISMADNQVEVVISMVSDTMLPVEVWGGEPDRRLVRGARLRPVAALRPRPAPLQERHDQGR